MTQFWTWGELHALLDGSPGITPDLLDALLDAAPAAPSAYNVCPSQEPMVIGADSNRITAERVTWGIPRHDPSGSTSLVSNARSETIDTQPMFRDAFAHARCLVPANGFYEWETLAPRDKQPWYFSPANKPLCFFAAVATRVGSESGIAIVTAPTPESCHTKIHHRMPCVIMPEQAACWLGLPTASPTGPRSCLRAFGSDHAFAFNAHAVTKRVNKAMSSGPDLLVPVEPDRGLFN